MQDKRHDLGHKIDTKAVVCSVTQHTEHKITHKTRNAHFQDSQQSIVRRSTPAMLEKAMTRQGERSSFPHLNRRRPTMRRFFNGSRSASSAGLAIASTLILLSHLCLAQPIILESPINSKLKQRGWRISLKGIRLSQIDSDLGDGRGLQADDAVAFRKSKKRTKKTKKSKKTIAPTVSQIPSSSPTISSPPSNAPSSSPSTQPSISHVPTISSIPSSSPSVQPSTFPSSFPSVSPTEQPSKLPSNSPSATPTTSSRPSTMPSESPSVLPSTSPTQTPSTYPSETPSTSPSSPPTPEPTVSPQPSAMPSTNPTSKPTVWAIETLSLLSEDGNPGLVTRCIESTVKNESTSATETTGPGKEVAKILTYEYTINIDAGTDLAGIFLAIEETLQVILSRNFLRCPQPSERREFRALQNLALNLEFFYLDSVPRTISFSTLPPDRMKQNGVCTDDEAQAGKECYVISGGFTTQFPPFANVGVNELVPIYMPLIRDSIENGDVERAHPKLGKVFFRGYTGQGDSGDETIVLTPSGVSAAQQETDNDDSKVSAVGGVLIACLFIAALVVAFLIFCGKKHRKMAMYDQYKDHDKKKDSVGRQEGDSDTFYTNGGGDSPKAFVVVDGISADGSHLYEKGMDGSKSSSVGVEMRHSYGSVRMCASSTCEICQRQCAPIFVPSGDDEGDLSIPTLDPSYKDSRMKNLQPQRSQRSYAKNEDRSVDTIEL